MNTPTHAIANLLLLGGRQRPEVRLPVAIGAVLPDIPIVLIAAFARWVLGHPWGQVWSETYFQPWSQNLVAVPHSFPLIGMGWILAHVRGWRAAEVLLASMFLHSLLDFPVHTNDAHKHFFPFSEYRFHSPVSYWDLNHYGSYVAAVELLLVAAGTLVLFPVVRSRAGRALLVLVSGVYLLVYVRFYLI